ncbi:MAG: tetratricopeptide repeat protein [Acidimicrobiia bacterium]
MISGGREEEAEALLRKVLTDRPDHPAAGLMVASLLLDRDEPEAALEVLERLPATPDVTRLMAGARLGSAGEQGLPSLETAVAADPEDHAARISLGRALMTAGRPQEGLERLLEVIEAKNDWSDEARQAFLDVLEVLGADHVLAVDYRRRLANALF